MRARRTLAAVAAWLGLAGAAQATPIYYTFSGRIDSIFDYTVGTDGAYVPALGGLSAGQTVVWTLMVDSSLPGDFVWEGGPGGPYGPPVMHSQFHSGSVLPVTGADPARRSDLSYAYDAGASSDSFIAGSAFPGRNPHYTQIMVPFSIGGLGGLAVGQSGFTGSNYVDDRYGPGASGLHAIASGGDFTLTRIGETPPGGVPEAVPEPGTLALVGAGLAALGLRYRRRTPAS